MATNALLRDRLGRPLEDLRISVIDRCNFRCHFCMPPEREYEFLPRAELLTFEEITRLAGILAGLGVRKIRLTGGEPLLRRDIVDLVGQLAKVPGVEDLALTTNGSLLQEKAGALRAAGLRRVTVSVESLDPKLFAELNGVGFQLDRVLRGIDAALEAGLGPVKINVVVMRGRNEHELVEIARYFKERRCVVRFIEFMDVGTLNGWRRQEVLSAASILRRVGEALPLEPLERERPGDPALRFRYLDDGVEVGAIASITQPFCGSCSRIRLSSDGHIFTCLFGHHGTDFKQLLRGGASDATIEDAARELWTARTDRYSEDRAAMAGGAADDKRIEMFRIGG